MKKLAAVLWVMMVSPASAQEFIIPPETIAQCFFPSASIPDDIWDAKIDRSSPPLLNDISAEADDSQIIVVELGESRSTRLWYSFQASRKKDLVAVNFLTRQELTGVKPLPMTQDCRLSRWTRL
jgi:hypothetical protein